MKTIINKYYKDFPICYKSYEVIGNEIILTLVNLEKGIINTIYVDYLQKEYEFEVQSDQSIVECKITNINPNLIGIINFKGVKYNNKFYNIKDYKLQKWKSKYAPIKYGFPSTHFFTFLIWLHKNLPSPQVAQIILKIHRTFLPMFFYQLQH